MISLTNRLQQLFKNLFEREIEFLSSYFSEKCQNVYKIRKFGLLEFYQFYNIIEIINTPCSKLRILQYFIAEQTFLNIILPINQTDTDHIPSTITLNYTLLHSVQKLSSPNI